MIEQLKKALADLGETHEQVAARLKEKGIRGNRISFGSCPIALYLQKELGAKIGVDGMMATVIDDDGFQVESARLPQACSLFTSHFDAGKYPDLICSAFEPYRKSEIKT